MKTNKSDWLNDRLASEGSIIVSGHSSASSYFNLGNDLTVSVRFAGNRNVAMSAFFTIEAEETHWGAILAQLSNTSSNCARRVAELGVMLKLEMPCIVYSNNNDKFAFHYKDISTVLNSRDLQHAIGQIDANLVKDCASSKAEVKEINKSTNDTFQDWGRSNLSKYLVVNDFDAIGSPDSKLKIVYELKRVQEDLITWRPYLDDSSNYASLKLLCERAGLRMRVIAYQADKLDLVAVHHIASISKESIVGSLIICPPDYIVSHQLGISYVSNKRRKS